MSQIQILPTSLLLSRKCAGGRAALKSRCWSYGRFGALVCPGIESTGVVTNSSALIASAPDMKEFLDRLTREFEPRQADNKRYSLRAFSAFLKTDHSTLSQILRGTRRIPTAQLRRWGGKLDAVSLTRRTITDTAYFYISHAVSPEVRAA